MATARGHDGLLSTAIVRGFAACGCAGAWRKNRFADHPLPARDIRLDKVRQLYPEASCQPMRPRSAMASMCRSRRVGAVSAVSLVTALERGGTMTAAPGWRAATSA